METELAREFVERSDGPFHSRRVLQPFKSVLFALRDGRADAQAKAAPYIQRLLGGGASERRAVLQTVRRSMVKVLAIAISLDCAFQLATQGSFPILGAVCIAFLLCAVPYTILRRPVARWITRTQTHSRKPTGD